MSSTGIQGQSLLTSHRYYRYVELGILTQSHPLDLDVQVDNDTHAHTHTCMLLLAECSLAKTCPSLCARGLWLVAPFDASGCSWCVSALVMRRLRGCMMVRAARMSVPTSALRLFGHRSCALAPPCLLLRVAAALSGMVRGAFLVAFLVAPALLMLVLVV